MRFLDRKNEMARLLRLSDAGRGGFAAIWGRRRIGKSELLKEWCRRAHGLYTVADQTASSVQRENFAVALSERFPGFGDVRYPTWKSLFAALSQRAAAEGWHGPLAMDEFPYWVESDGSLPSVLQNWIDAEKSRGGIVSAIAGSSQHMMQGLVLDADEPLYGRADEKMRLDPISPRFMGEALGLDDPVAVLMAYSVWGGVPRYWVAAERYGKDLDAAVDEQVLDPLGLFHDEPMTLLQSEIPSAASLKPYLDVIGGGANRVSEIAGRLGVSATALSRPLARLMELGLIRREIPFGESEKNSKKSLYRLADPFCKFWFGVVASRRSVFARASGNVRKSVWRGVSEQVFAAEWEEQCRRSVTSSAGLGKLAGKGDYWLPAGRWWSGNQPEWDIVSVNGTHTRTFLGEAKWSQRPFDRDELRRLVGGLLDRTPPPGLPEDTVRVLFVASAESGPGILNGVRVYTAEQIIGK